MVGLIDTSAAATAWIEKAFTHYAAGKVFGRVDSVVIWSDSRDAEGALIIELDPANLAAKINDQPFPVLLGHDPGRPLGKLLAAEVFTGSAGDVFVVAVMGFYGEAQRLNFSGLGIDVDAEVPSPTELPTLPVGIRFALHADPREIDLKVLEELASTAPIPVDVEPLSNNASSAPHTLVLISAMFVALMWNPFVTTFANEAAKDAYAGLRRWLTEVTVRLTQYRNPIIEVQSTHGGCTISFMFRSQDIERQYKAHTALPNSAAQAAHLITQMRGDGHAPIRLVYEFHPVAERWYPSFAELSDGRFVSDDASLIALENLPSGVSLGLRLSSLDEPD